MTRLKKYRGLIVALVVGVPAAMFIAQTSPFGAVGQWVIQMGLSGLAGYMGSVYDNGNN